MCISCNVSSSNKKNEKSTLRKSINGRWTNFIKTCLLYIKTCMFYYFYIHIYEKVSFLKAHSCVEKAGLIAMVKVRQLPVDEHYSLRGKTLDEYIREDKRKGLVPFFVRYLF